jgi:hypothetical protein
MTIDELMNAFYFNLYRREITLITREQQKAAQKEAAEMIRQAGIAVTDKEADSIEVVDFGLGNLSKESVYGSGH